MKALSTAAVHIRSTAALTDDDKRWLAQQRRSLELGTDMYLFKRLGVLRHCRVVVLSDDSPFRYVPLPHQVFTAQAMSLAMAAVMGSTFREVRIESVRDPWTGYDISGYGCFLSFDGESWSSSVYWVREYERIREELESTGLHPYFIQREVWSDRPWRAQVVNAHHGFDLSDIDDDVN
ncbi:hypothetical protein QCD60_30265 [Pokkaliibacter sp. MBI-7]|uniref:hypothetical protein n=1 Tax=Pokkaliibacter sp. MBI-7 TaxID=3040600 RepID=UPI00244971FF|nr:hypothetical protein [Pokkaliibacter sp. MBI-7]MDH2431006.1 hypothetical protein [Pokkaliibacter sp. MBI-7]MDH2436701.1 hypothetical protein [Pokkaliibacter sp. MBI-7]MDH2436801.1 hypothetical protein [Pokkaliibacter sp. MBI-7]